MDRFMAYLDDKAELLRQNSQRLTESGCRDDGDFAKIRANVFGICKSLFQALEPEKACAKMSELRDTWGASLAVARAHQDVKKAVIEEIKLETLAEITLAMGGMKEG